MKGMHVATAIMRPFFRSRTWAFRVRCPKDLPNDFNVVIQIPMHAEPIKYEVDKESG